MACPQCGGALPRQALWRIVACPYCSAMVTRNTQVVQREPFRQAWQRSLALGRDGGRILRVAGRDFRVLRSLAEGEHTEVLLADACGPLPERVTLKVARSVAWPLAGEADVLRRLQALQIDGSAYFSQRLPQVVAHGQIDGVPDAREALAWRHPNGFWGSLADVLAFHPQGIQDVRHAVWLWRRVLEVLAYVHRGGWTHGDLRPEHWLVHPADHGVLLIGWGRARRGGDAARDLVQSAWAIRQLLQGHGDTPPAIPSRVPGPLADLLHTVSESADAAARMSAEQIDQALVAAARQAFGPPQFIHFNPQRA
ncbi:protein kinase family protein [Ideonella sp. BN130291]|uniref:protein kinase family protein n=1 Tax=Ideonella sp. BN130291 TaxID=3112940 RepID=UPI002E267363|nr:protein kinase family protein [Ideonella sp. BN130291]